jgi:quercetin dioxygenase-like cupin family protein
MSAVQSLPPGISPTDSFYRTLPEHGPIEPLHSHDETITIHVLEGVVYLVSEEDERALTPGDQATLRPGELHRLHNAGDGEAHLLEGVRPAHCEGLD